MIEMDEKLIGIWYLYLGGMDWMAGVREIVPEEKYELTYRFRHYTGDQSKSPFEDGDKKNWFRGHVTGTRAYVIAILRGVAKDMYIRSSAEDNFYELLNDKGVKDLMRRFQDLPFVYAQVQPIERGK